MKYIEKHPMIMVIVGLLGVSLSSIFVRLADGPSVVTAACRLLWTVLLLTPGCIWEFSVSGDSGGHAGDWRNHCLRWSVCIFQIRTRVKSASGAFLLFMKPYFLARFCFRKDVSKV